MTISQLHTFLSACRNMSFTQAAKAQYISQPAVSRQISALEDELGARLFERTRSTLQLTAAGEHLFRHLEPILTHLDALLNQVKEIGTGQSGSLAIGLLMDQAMDQHISRALQWFRQTHNISITIHRIELLELQAGLENGSVDIAVSVDSTGTMFQDFEGFIYAVESMCFCAQRDLLLKYNGRSDEEAILHFVEQHPVLVPKLSSFPKQQQEALKQNVRKQAFAAYELEYDLPSIAPMVCAGLGATFVNESHALSVDQTVVLVPMSGMSPVNKGIFWSASASNPVVPLFADFVRSADSLHVAAPDLFGT